MIQIVKMVKMLQQQNVFYLTQWAPVSLEIPTLMVVMIQKDTNFEDHQKGANCDQNNAKKVGICSIPALMVVIMQIVMMQRL